MATSVDGSLRELQTLWANVASRVTRLKVDGGEGALLAHELGGVNMVAVVNTLNGKIDELKSVLQEYRTMLLTNDPRQTRLLVQLQKLSSRACTEHSSVKAAVETAGSVLKSGTYTSSGQSSDGGGGCISIAALEKLAKAVGFQVFVDARSTGTVATLTGTHMLIDVTYDPSGEIVSATLDIDPLPASDLNSARGAALLNLLKSTDVGRLQHSLLGLFSFDHACNAADPLWIHDALRLFADDYVALNNAERALNVPLLDRINSGTGLFLPIVNDSISSSLVFALSPRQRIKLGLTSQLVTENDVVARIAGCQRGNVAIESSALSTNIHNGPSVVSASTGGVDLAEFQLFQSEHMSPFLRDSMQFVRAINETNSKQVQLVFHLVPPVPACFATLELLKGGSSFRYKQPYSHEATPTAWEASIQRVLLNVSNTSSSLGPLETVTTSSQFAVTLKNQQFRQLYSMDDSFAAGCMVHRVPFSHISQLVDIVHVLRRQLLFNELFTSCFRIASAKESTSSPTPSDFSIEILSEPPSSITLNVSNISLDLIVTVVITIDDNLAVKVQSYPQHILGNLDGELQQILQRTLSIPVTLTSLLPQLPKLLPPPKLLPTLSHAPSSKPPPSQAQHEPPSAEPASAAAHSPSLKSSNLHVGNESINGVVDGMDIDEVHEDRPGTSPDSSAISAPVNAPTATTSRSRRAGGAKASSTPDTSTRTGSARKRKQATTD